MNYLTPQFSVSEVNRAARSLIAADDAADLQFEKTVVDNWRVAHQFPLNSMYMTLKGRVKRVSAKALTAQRIKRLPSIRAKLLDRPEMKLSQMQDVGGCRAVMPTLDALLEVRDVYLSRPITHQFGGEKDYISHPKTTGYRGIHLKYRFAGNGRSEPWKGLKIEVQLRTLLQHKWATAVEAAATFTNAQLKSNQGSAEWLRFFALMSSYFAIQEGCPIVPGTPRGVEEIRREVRALNRQHHIVETFERYSVIIPHIERRTDAVYFLVTLDPLQREVSVVGYKKRFFAAANNAYLAAEGSLPEATTKQVVLVSVSSITALKKAYPNYFLDTQDFLREVRNLISYP
ncbi:RelA/SpoT domain-containing protein [Arenimonas sp.]|uniref:RelA/SpoT domain-containing protein n=1 Tax=Arenimonas sp. TaxID=1872635 RepID=UPI002E35675E|nr:RelA/SpoT domain-containing protein [Arenimonas sp.]HEX4854835.1 RelA/SpoT domain-containing protein [Arenimonas sp.]